MRCDLQDTPPDVKLLVLDDLGGLLTSSLPTSAEHAETSPKPLEGNWKAVVLAAGLAPSTYRLDALRNALIMLVQWQSTRSVIPLWVSTLGVQPVRAGEGMVRCTHSAAWGLSRACRREGVLSLHCLDLDATADSLSLAARVVLQPSIQPAEGSVRGLRVGPSLENEMVLRRDNLHIARLVSPFELDRVPARLTIARKGAITGLRLEPQGEFESELLSSEVEVEVRAVGLNFRDVLIVLDQYPGPRTEPGTDCAGVVRRVGGNVRHLSRFAPSFGLSLIHI